MRDREGPREGEGKGCKYGLVFAVDIKLVSTVSGKVIQFCTLNNLKTDEHVGHSVGKETKEPF